MKILRSFGITLAALFFCASCYGQNICPPLLIKSGEMKDDHGSSSEYRYSYEHSLKPWEMYIATVVIDKYSYVDKTLSDYAANQIAMYNTSAKIAREIKNTTGATYVIVNIVYTTECTVDLRTILRIDKTQRIYCCENPATDPKIYEINGNYFYDLWTKKVCGQKCCMKSFGYSFDYNPNVPKLLSTSVLDYSTCDGSAQYFDCKTGDPRSCGSNPCE